MSVGLPMGGRRSRAPLSDWPRSSRPTREVLAGARPSIPSVRGHSRGTVWGCGFWRSLNAAIAKRPQASLASRSRRPRFLGRMDGQPPPRRCRRVVLSLGAAAAVLVGAPCVVAMFSQWQRVSAFGEACHALEPGVPAAVAAAPLVRRFAPAPHGPKTSPRDTVTVVAYYWEKSGPLFNRGCNLSVDPSGVVTNAETLIVLSPCVGTLRPICDRLSPQLAHPFEY